MKNMTFKGLLLVFTLIITGIPSYANRLHFSNGGELYDVNRCSYAAIKSAYSFKIPITKFSRELNKRRKSQIPIFQKELNNNAPSDFMKFYFSYHQKKYYSAKNKANYLQSKAFKEFKTDLLHFLQAGDLAYSFLEKFISNLLRERSNLLKEEMIQMKLEDPELLLQGAGIHTSILLHGLLHRLPEYKDNILIIEQSDKVANSFLGHNFRLNSVDVKRLKDTDTGSIGSPNYLAKNPFQTVDFTPSHMPHDTKARDLGIAVLLNYYLSGVKIIFDTQLIYDGFGRPQQLLYDNKSYPINPARVGRSFGPNQRIVSQNYTQSKKISFKIEAVKNEYQNPFQRKLMNSSEFNLEVAKLVEEYGPHYVLKLLKNLEIAFVGFGNGGMTALESIVNPLFETQKNMTFYERLEMQDRIEKNLPKIDIYGVEAKDWEEFKRNYLIPGGLERKRHSPTMAFIERYSTYGLFDAFTSSKTRFYPDKINEVSADKSTSKIDVKSEVTNKPYDLVILAYGKEGTSQLGNTDFGSYVFRAERKNAITERVQANTNSHTQRYYVAWEYALDHKSGYLHDFFYGTALPNLFPRSFYADTSLTKSPHSIHYLGPGTEKLANKLANEIERDLKGR
ncbi:MAG: hypothetical protein VX642_04625 [Bdellovibrionota bacterium]|nr:hypothetical protein [Bdellovibrionota bacterium]